MGERYTIEVTAQAEQYARVYRESVQRSLRKAWRAYRDLLYFVIPPGLCAFLLYILDPSTAASPKFTFALFCALIATAFAIPTLLILVRWLRLWRRDVVRLRKIVADPDIVATLDYTLEFDDEELVVVSNRELKQIHWETFDNVEVTPLTLYLERYGRIWAMFSREALGEEIFQAMVKAATTAQQRKSENTEE